MKFIFPQNYNFKNKLLGIIDYSTAFINLLWYGIIFILVNFIFSNLTLKLFFFIIFCFPLLLFSFVGFHGENIISFLTYIIRFYAKPKLYLYK